MSALLPVGTIRSTQMLIASKYVFPSVNYSKIQIKNQILPTFKITQ